MPNRLTLDIVNDLDFGRVVYIEETHPGAMGNIGGVVLEVFDGGRLARFETSLEIDKVAAAKIKDHREQFDYHYGGFGNEVYFRKRTTIIIDEQSHQFIFESDGRQYPFSSSVRGVFNRVAASLKALVRN
jgi:hypothetical protein